MEELKILTIEDKVLAEIPLGFRLIYFKDLPENGDVNGHIHIERYHGRCYTAGHFNKPISKI